MNVLDASSSGQPAPRGYILTMRSKKRVTSSTLAASRNIESSIMARSLQVLKRITSASSSALVRMYPRGAGCHDELAIEHVHLATTSQCRAFPIVIYSVNYFPSGADVGGETIRLRARQPCPAPSVGRTKRLPLRGRSRASVRRFNDHSKPRSLVTPPSGSCSVLHVRPGPSADQQLFRHERACRSASSIPNTQLCIDDRLVVRSCCWNDRCDNTSMAG